MVAMARLAPKSEPLSQLCTRRGRAAALLHPSQRPSRPACLPAHPTLHRRRCAAAAVAALTTHAFAPAAGMLSDREQARGLARALDPLIRAVDWAVGEKVAMLVEVEYESEGAAWGCEC